MELIDSCLVTAVSLPAGFAVIYLYRRARSLFFLDKEDRFAAAKKKPTSKPGDKKIKFDASSRGSMGSAKDDNSGRLSEIVQDLDGRNESFYHGGGRQRKSTLRRSVSWDATQANVMTEEEYSAATNAQATTSIANRWAFFKRSKAGGGGDSTRNPVRSSGNNNL
jgi:hypothetical protein